MKNLIKFLLFLAYIIAIFWIKHNLFTIAVICINVLLTIALKISIKEELGNILEIISFVILTIIVNVFVVNVETGIRIGIKLILVSNITYIFSRKTTYADIADALEKIFSLFKFCKINPKNISLMICIAITFIPTIKKQIKQVRDALKAKGIRMKLKDWKYIFEPLMISLLKRVDDIENSLKAKAYQEL